MIQLGKRFRYPLYGLGVVGTVGLCSVIWLGSGSGEEWARAMIERSISEAMSSGSVELGSVSTNGFSHIELGGLELVDASGNDVVSLDELVVEFNPLAIVLGKVSVKSVAMSGVGLDIEVDEEGVSSLAKMFVAGDEGQDSGALGLEVHVGEFEINEVTVNYREATADLEGPVEHVVTIDLQGAFQFVDGTAHIPNVSGEAAINGTDIDFEAELYSSSIETSATVELTGLGSRVVGSGRYSPVMGGEEQWGLTLSEVELDLQALGEIVDLPLLGRVVASVTGAQAGGVASINGTLQHGGGELAVAGELAASHSILSLVPSELDLTAITPLVTEPVVLSGALRLNSETLAGLASPEIEFDLEDSVIWGIEVSAGSLVGRFDGEQLIVDELLLESPMMSASASGVVNVRGAELALVLSGVDIAQLQQFGVPSMRGVGAAEGQLEINWEGEEVEVDWEGGLYARRLYYPEIARFSSISGPVRASVRGERFSASGESVATGISAGVNTLELMELQWRVDSDESLEWSSTVSAESLSSGDILVRSLTGRVAGSGDSVHGRLDLTQINGFTQVWPSGTLRFDLRDRFRFTGSILGGGSNELSLDIVSDRDFSEFELKELSVALGDQPGWATTGSTIIRRGGDSLAVRGLELVSAGGGSVRLDATGSMSGPISANLHLAQFPLDWVEPWIDESGFEGLISGDITLGGRSEALRVEADLTGVGLTLPDTVSGLDCQISLRADEESFGWEAEIASDGTSMANLEGKLPAHLSLSGFDVDWAGPLEIDGVLSPVSNSHWRDGVPALSDLPAGRSSASIHIRGTLLEPEGEINAGVAWRLGSDNRQYRVDLGLELDGSEVTLVGSGRSGGVHLFDLRGYVGTAIGRALSSLSGADVVFPDTGEWVDSFEVGLAPMGVSVDLLRGFAPLPEALNGLVSGSISVVGGVSEPRAVVGISLSEGSFGRAQIPSAVLSLVPSDAHYDLSMFASVGVGSLVVTGSVPFGGVEAEGLELEIEGPDLPLELLTGVVPEMSQVSGSIGLEGQIRGSISALVPRVAMSIGGAFDMLSLGVGFSEIQVEAVLNEGGVDVTSFSGETERLSDISGDLFDSNGSFEGALEYSFNEGLAGGFVCENLWLSATPKETLRTTGHLSIEGPITSANVVGEFVVDEGRYVLTSSDWLTNSEVALSSDITLHRDGTELAVVAPDEPVFFEGWSVSLGVDLAHNTWVDVSMPLDDTFGSVTSAVSTVGLDGRLDGELQVDYSPEILSSNDVTGEVLRSGGLDVVGELLVIRGNTKVFGKDFAVDDGSVRFTGGGLEEPELDISATHTNREYGDIVVDIAGQPRKMALAFSSSESWSDTDMASILLLGRPVSSLTQSEGGAGLNLVGTALGVMAGTASNLVQMSSMVDTLEVESEGESISSLSVGWALGSDLFVTYSKDYTALAGDNISEITLEWLISKRIQAELSTGDRGQSSADLYMKWRF